jgi:hypothetical protein
MQFVNNLFRRREILPWYDSNSAIIIAGLFMLLTLLFGLAGISVALNLPEYKAHVWLPAMLVLLSSTGITSMLIRVIRDSSGSESENKKS